MEEDWAWGLSLIALTIVFHATGVALMAVVLQNVRDRMQEQGPLGARHVMIAISLIGATGLLLAMLHGAEAAVWATAYWQLGAIGTLEEAMFYSVDSITTRGASGLTLEQPWRTMGALEAANGVLLFGMSTAFLFAVMQAYSPLIIVGRRRR